MATAPHSRALPRIAPHSHPGLEKTGFLSFFGFFMGFQVSTYKSDTKLRPLSTMKSKDKSTEQRFGMQRLKSQFIFQYRLY